jgi:hypothetical protein
VLQITDQQTENNLAVIIKYLHIDPACIVSAQVLNHSRRVQPAASGRHSDKTSFEHVRVIGDSQDRRPIITRSS